MPYVPPEVKERIKREVSIQRLAEARGIKLQRVGRSLMGLCPFHDDRNPSLSIDPEKNEWHCFGCDRKGDVIEWVRCAEGELPSRAGAAAQGLCSIGGAGGEAADGAEAAALDRRIRRR